MPPERSHPSRERNNGPHDPQSPARPAQQDAHARDLVAFEGGDDEQSQSASIPAGWPDASGSGCVKLNPAAVLRAGPRSFALQVRGYSMVGADIHDGDIVVGEFTPEARPGSIVVALIDGESTLKRLVIHQGRPYLASENPNCPDLVPLSELVIQGVVHTAVKRLFMTKKRWT